MRRYFINKLLEWRDSVNRKPLVLSGARQVGKTWLLKEFGRTCFKKTAYVSFDRTESAKSLFEGDFYLKGIISGLQAICETEITPSDTLIILDEIQLCPAALKSLKYWQEEASEYCVATAGSLVGLALMGGTGYPVGKTNSMTLYPMSFREFLSATGEEQLSNLVASGDWRVLKAFHDSLVRRLKEYLFVGGMPAAVKSFAENRSFAMARAQQLEILSDYDRDFSKHANKSIVPRLRAIWRSMPGQLAKEDKRFVAAEVMDEKGERMRSRDLKDPFEWLEAAGIAYRVWNVRRPNIPLDAYRTNVFKLFGVDVGLIGAQSHLEAKSVLEGSQIFTEFKGALTEQFVQQEMRAEENIQPFYWSSEDSRTEIDFIMELGGLLVPIEVKAERNLRATSLKRFIERFSQKTAVRTSMAEWQGENNIVDIPLYAIGQIARII
jgi:predicted AAA+ superfamily ATPase